MAMQQSPDVGQPQPNVGSLDIERALGHIGDALPSQPLA